MLNHNGPQLFPPSQCQFCEFSFVVATLQQVTLYCCILYNTHVQGKQACCPKRLSFSSQELHSAWKKYALPWVNVFAEHDNKMSPQMELEVLRRTNLNPIAEDTNHGKENTNLPPMQKPNNSP